METRFFMPPESSEGNFAAASWTERILSACMTFSRMAFSSPERCSRG